MGSASSTSTSSPSTSPWKTATPDLVQDGGTDVSDTALEDNRDVPQTYKLTKTSSSSLSLDVSVGLGDDAVEKHDPWTAIGDPAVFDHIGAQFDEEIPYPQQLSL